MLASLVQRVSQQITAIDPREQAPAFARHWQALRPEIGESLAASSDDPKVREAILQIAAAGALIMVRKLPEMMQVMLDRLADRQTEPSVRCLIATVLAYVVQPRDLIPDDAPGGYGFIDDAVVMYGGYLDLLNLEPPNAGQFKTRKQYLEFAASFAPRDVIPALQQSLQGMEITMSFFRMIPREMLDMTTQIIVANPLAAAGASANSFPSASLLGNFRGSAMPQYTYQDGRNLYVSFPGGGGVFSDGRDIFPL